MRVLCLAPRYGSRIVGGSVLYLRTLLSKLARRGVEVEVLATRSASLDEGEPFAMRWGEDLPPREVLDEVQVRRLKAFALPRRVAARMGSRLRRNLERELGLLHLVGEGEAGHLASGWYYLEVDDEGVPFRWASESASVAVAANASGLCFEAFSPRAVRGQIVGLGGRSETFDVQGGGWHAVECRLPPEDGFYRLSVDHTFTPEGDPRQLGVAVRRLRSCHADGEQHVNLEEGITKRLAGLDNEALTMLYAEQAENRSALDDRLHTLLRGPLSPGLELAALRKAWRSDVVLGAEIPFRGLTWAPRLAMLAHKPCVLLPFFHERDRLHHWASCYRAFRQARAVVTLSASSNAFFERLGARPRVVPGGIEPEELAATEGGGEAFRRRFGIATDAEVVLFVGRKNAAKRYDMLAAAVERLRASGRDVFLVMAGPEEDGLPLPSDHVVFTGRLSRAALLDAYRACDVFAMMSDHESFGLVFLEAWMLGKPVVGSQRCGASRDLIDDGADGFLCGSLDELTTRLGELLSNPLLAARFGQVGRAKVLDRLTWDRACDALHGVLREVVEN